MTAYVAYHGISGSAHQSRVRKLGSQGYRPISLSVSGDPGDARYAAVWVQRPGPGWHAVHGLSPAAYQSTFEDLTGQGFSPALVDATGPADLASFTALFERDVPGRWFARHHLRWGPDAGPGALVTQMRRAYDEGFLPRSLAAYGTDDDPRFAGVWWENQDAVPWSWWRSDHAGHQRHFEALVLARTRPASVSHAPGAEVLSVFHDHPLGPFSARHALTGEQYQAEFDSATAEGLVPVFISAGGTGTGTRYASLLAGTDQPHARSWQVTGVARAVADGLDGMVRTFMARNAVRAGAVAVSRAGKTVVQRGYTWAEPGYPVTRPDTLFRLASVSKAITVAALDQLVSQGRLSWDTPVFPRLGVTRPLLPGQHPDPRTDNITVLQMALRSSGLRRDFGDLRALAGRLGTTGTPSRGLLVRFVYGEPLAAPPAPPDPAAAGLYSNVAFTVLTSLIEAVAGRSYINQVRESLLAPHGITDVYVAATEHGRARSGEVASYDHPSVALSLLEPATDRLVPNVHGGQFTLENSEGSGGLLGSAPSVAEFLSHHAVWNVGPREVSARYGRLDGTTAGAFCRPDGLDVAFLFNRRVADSHHETLHADIDEWLNASAEV